MVIYAKFKPNSVWPLHFNEDFVAIFVKKKKSPFRACLFHIDLTVRHTVKVTGAHALPGSGPEKFVSPMIHVHHFRKLSSV